MNNVQPIVSDILPADVQKDVQALNELAGQMASIATRLNRAGYAPVYDLWDWSNIGCTVKGMLQGNTSRVALYRMSDRGRA